MMNIKVKENGNAVWKYKVYLPIAIRLCMFS